MTEQHEEQVNHPKHYNVHKSGIECIDLIELLPCNLANAVKYAWRAGEKASSTRELDLQKCWWYLKREVQLLDRQHVREFRIMAQATVADMAYRVFEADEQAPVGKLCKTLFYDRFHGPGPSKSDYDLLVIARNNIQYALGCIADAEKREKILGAALLIDGHVNQIIVSSRRQAPHDISVDGERAMYDSPWRKGFFTSESRFVDREAARKIAERAYQLLPDAIERSELFSEDLW